MEKTEESESGGLVDGDAVTAETRCGLGWFAPRWLQPLASKKTFVLVYGVLGSSFFANGSYFGATISTMEKEFKMSSQTIGMISSGLDLALCCTVLISAYFGSRGGHKPRWVGMGAMLVALSCFMTTVPYFLFGVSSDALLLAEVPADSAESNNSTLTIGGGQTALCGSEPIAKDCTEGIQLSTVAIILFAARVINGVGHSMYWTLGVAYLDDNVRKTKSPIYLSIAASLRMFGPTAGFLLASYTLSIFVEPSLHPTIDSDDPRWIGAWWLGWIPCGVVTFVLGLTLSMFPRVLPRAAIRARIEAGTRTKESESTERSIKDFTRTIRTLVRNKVYMFNSLSLTFFFFGYIGYWTFLPKYMETQFRQSASRSSLIIGSLGVVSSGVGLLTTGVIMTCFQPGPRKLAAWNVAVELVEVCVRIVYMFIGCPVSDLHGHWTQEQSWNLTMDCNSQCDCGLTGGSYAPVCSFDKTTTYYSACYAGCQSQAVTNHSQSYFECSCAGHGGPMSEGACPVDCYTNFMIFVFLECLVRFLSATGRAGNSLIQYRCVNPQDKSVSLGLAEIIFNIFAFIPGPIIYGMILDSTCLVWGTSCGKTGNCWLYDGQSLRYVLNGTAAAFMLLGTAMDVGVWVNVKGLQIYEDDHRKEEYQIGVETGQSKVKQDDGKDIGGEEMEEIEGARMLRDVDTERRRTERGSDTTNLQSVWERQRASQESGKVITRVYSDEDTAMMRTDEDSETTKLQNVGAGQRASQDSGKVITRVYSDEDTAMMRTDEDSETTKLQNVGAGQRASQDSGKVITRVYSDEDTAMMRTYEDSDSEMKERQNSV